ncbi:MAG: DEAD/DEAH box helicase [Dysgonamonadaceae bacterium]|jgi:SNF2 family DNA or RNA helicase|nr:DEAD/DEAH box helicase [Dysgonamonadaceae bacterium]
MNTLIDIKNRIKGSKLWTQGGITRVYLPYRINRQNIRTDCYFEIINDKLELLVKVRSLLWNVNPNWCDLQAEALKENIQKQYYEIIHDCEKKRRKVPLHIRLRDDTEPVSQGSMPHQVAALKFLCSMKVSAYFGDTGVGKTKVAIDLATSRFVAGKIRKVMVFCPVSTIENFKIEVNLFSRFPKLVWQYFGIESMSMSDATYLEALNEINNATMIIIDESHLVKGVRAVRSERIKEVCDRCTYKLVMTGTPTTDNVHDLYMQYSMLSELITECKSWVKFAEQFLILGGWDSEQIVGHKNLEYLASLIEPYTYQTLKKECLSLPEKSFQTFTCRLTANQEHYYFHLKRKLLEIIEDTKDDNLRSETVFLYLTRLQQVTCGYIRHEDGTFEYIGTNKFDLIDHYIDIHKQTIFFCKYIFEVDLLIEYLGAENCVEFTGRNRTSRYENLKLFSEGKKSYFVATMSSGGTGLNGLQHCNQLVFFSNSFKYSERKHSIGRIDREGQKNQMSIIDLITSAGIDWKIMKNLSRKRDLSDEIRRLIDDKIKLREYIQSI